MAKTFFPNDKQTLYINTSYPNPKNTQYYISGRRIPTFPIEIDDFQRVIKKVNELTLNRN